jgi:ATP-dependent RNA helicase DOB1
MKRVLRRLGHTNSDNVIELKGRIACEVSTADELLITELVFTGSLANLTAEQIVSLMSCLVAQERNADSEDAKVNTEEMKAPVETLQALAKRIGTVKLECKMQIDVDEYVKSFSVQLVDLVFEWCRGKRFVELMMMTKQYEGSIIRMLHRLEELMRQLMTASKAIGDSELEDKCARGGAMLRRDIVFAASLYLDDVTAAVPRDQRPPAV